MQDATATRQFFEALYPADVPEGLCVLVWSVAAGGGAKTSRWATSVVGACEAAVAEDEKPAANVYAGVGLSPRDFGAKQRCKADQVAGIPGLWLDLDVAGEAHKKKTLPATVEEAAELADAAGVRPTVLVHSGHGLQAWWLFNEPWVFADDAARDDAADLARRWKDLFARHAALRGWTVDSTFDLARVMRVPGTVNRKGEPPVPVRILAVNPERYEPAALRELCGDAIKAANRAEAAAVAVGKLRLDRNANPDPGKFGELCVNEPLAVLTWNHQRADLADQSNSSYDWCLTVFAIEAGWEDQEIADLIIAHRRRHGGVEKALRTDDVGGFPGYVAYNIGRARRRFAERGGPVRNRPQSRASDQQQEAAANTAGAAAAGDHRGAPATPSALDGDEQVRHVVTMAKLKKRDVAGDERLAALSESLGVTLLRVVKYPATPPKYAIFTPGGKVNLDDVRGLINQQNLRTAFAAVDGVYMKTIDKRDWPTVAQRLLDACELEDPGDEASDTGQLISWLGEYLENNGPVERPAADDETEESADVKAKVATRTPFLKEGCLYLFGGKFREWLGARWQKIDSRELAVLVRQTGGESAKVRHGENSTRAAYRWPLDKLREHGIELRKGGGKGV